MTHPTYSGGRRSGILAALAVILSACYCGAQEPAPAPAAPRIGPPYKQLKFDERLRAANSTLRRTAERVVVGVVNDNSTDRDHYTEGKTDDVPNSIWFKNFFTLYFFPRMAELDSATGAPKHDLPQLRKILFQQYLGRIRKEKQYQDLHKLTFETMRELITGNYHPAVRYNAMIIMGELNTQEGTGVGSLSERRPPVPDFEALAFLFGQYRTNPPDYLRVAILLGFARHAALDGQRPAGQRLIKLEWKNAIVNEIAKILLADKPPANRTASGHRWMQSMVMQILGDFHDPGVGNVYAAKMEKIFTDPNQPLDFRVDAALAFSKLDIPKDQLKIGQNAVQIGYLALDAAESEIAQLQKELQRRELESANASEGSGPIGFGGGANALLGEAPPKAGASEATLPDAFRIRALRRRLKTRLAESQFALRGTNELKVGGLRRFAANEKEAKLIDGLGDQIFATMKKLDDSEMPLSQVIAGVESEANKLRNLVDSTEFKRVALSPPSDDDVLPTLPTVGTP